MKIGIFKASITPFLLCVLTQEPLNNLGISLFLPISHDHVRRTLMMDRKTGITSLIGGGVLFIYSLYRIYRGEDVTLLIISVLIIAFSVHGILKARQKKD